MDVAAAIAQQRITGLPTVTPLAAPAVRAMTPPEGDATPQTHAAASLTG